MHEVSHQEEVASEIINFLSFKLLVKLGWRILWSSIDLERPNWLFRFLYVFSHQRNIAHKTIAFGQLQSIMCIWPNWIPWFFDHQYLWKESSYMFVWPLSIFSPLFLRIPYQNLPGSILVNFVDFVSYFFLDILSEKFEFFCLYSNICTQVLIRAFLIAV